MTDELHKIFDDSDSFYYSRTLDLTNSLQRQYEIEKVLETEEGTGKPITDITRWWKYVDDRFFWNKHMLKDIIALEVVSFIIYLKNTQFYHQILSCKIFGGLCGILHQVNCFYVTYYNCSHSYVTHLVCVMCPKLIVIPLHYVAKIAETN